MLMATSSFMEKLKKGEPQFSLKVPLVVPYEESIMEITMKDEWGVKVGTDINSQETQIRLVGKTQ